MELLRLNDGYKGRLKKTLFKSNKIYVGAGPYGYGVFTNQPIQKGELIEECVIASDIIPPPQLTNGKVFGNYTFSGVELPNGLKNSRVVLGFGSIYNHSDNPNIEFYQNKQYERILTIIAYRNINPGEELKFNYGYNPQDYI